MRLNISHKTGFRYDSSVRASYNEARMTPASTSSQRVWSSRVSIDPSAWSFSYTDYWGTTVTTFEVHERHRRLTVQAQAVVETRGDDLAWDSERRVAQNDLGWPALHDRGVTDSMSEFLTLNRADRAAGGVCSTWPASEPISRPGSPRWTSARWCTTGSATGAARPTSRVRRSRSGRAARASARTSPT